MNTEGLQEVFNECKNLASNKNADYGGTMDNIEMCGVHGIAVRLVDKITRAHNLSLPGKDENRKIRDESLRDTFRDIVNYGAFAVMLMDGTWHGELPSVELKQLAKLIFREGGVVVCPHCGNNEFPEGIIDISSNVVCPNCRAELNTCLNEPRVLEESKK